MVSDVSAVRIAGTDQPLALDVKRLAVPGTVESDCPRCGVSVDWNDDYARLEYPRVNEPFAIWFAHECETDDQHSEWSVSVTLRVYLEPASEPE